MSPTRPRSGSLGGIGLLLPLVALVALAALGMLATLARPAAAAPPVGTPTIVGTTEVGQTLTADVSGITDPDGLSNASFSYQWQQRSGDPPAASAIAGGNCSTLVLAWDDLAKPIRVAVRYTDDGGTEHDLYSAWTNAVIAPTTPSTAPENTAAGGVPTISGDALVGGTLTLDLSGLSDSDGLTNAGYCSSWNRGGQPIVGATGEAYMLTAADTGAGVSGVVTFNDDAQHRELVASAPSEAVTMPAPPNDKEDNGGPTVRANPNTEPTFDEGNTAARSLPENSVADTNIGTAFTATDPDPDDTLNFIVTGVESVNFIIDSGTGQLKTRPGITFDFESDNTFTVVVEVTDGKDGVGAPDPDYDDAITVTITLTNVDEEGTVTFEGFALTGSTLTASLTDLDGTPSEVTWQWARGDTEDGTFSDISGATSAAFMLEAGEATKYLRATASYTDPQGPGKTANATTAQIAVGNFAPTFDEGDSATREVPEDAARFAAIGTPVSATDPESHELRYGGTGADAPSFRFNLATGQVAISPDHTYNFEDKSSYSFTMEVSDSFDPSFTADRLFDDSIAVTINITNVDEDGTVTIDGGTSGGSVLTASLTDLDGTPTGVTWRWARGDTVDGSFSNISGATSAGYTTVAADVTKYLRATASYTDPEGPGKSASAVTAQIGSGNAEPEFDEGDTAMRSVEENSSTGTSVGSAVSATDGNDDTLTYSLSGGDASSFTIVSTSGQIQTKSGVTYNFENDSSYSVTVNVRDNKDSAGNTNSSNDDSIAVTISLTNVDEDGTVAITGTTSGGSTLTASVTDIDGTPTAVSWQWARADAESGPFSNLSGATSNSYTLVAGDVTKYVRATASYTDPQASGKSANGVTAQIGAGNAEPEFTEGDTADRSVQENRLTATNVGTPVRATDGDNDTLTYSWSGADRSSFAVDPSNGQIRTIAGETYDFEGDNSYSVTVTVRDSKDSAGNTDINDDDSIAVTISLTNVNEAPTIDAGPSSVSKDENTPTTETIATFEASDVDASTTLTWSLEGADRGDFRITKNADGEGELKFRVLPNYELPADADEMNDYNVTVKVSDGSLPATMAVTVTVEPVNEAPTITGGPTTRSVAENSTAVATYTASDVDASDTRSWSVEDADDGSKFRIDSSTGVLTFISAPDFETKADIGENNVYNATVKVTDAGGLSDTQSVAVTVMNVNEAPTIDAGPSSVSKDENTPTTETIAAFEASDVDASTTLTWSLDPDSTVSPDTGDFRITKNADGDGELTFRVSPNYELAADADEMNDYVVTVIVSDGSLTDTTTVTVTVDDVNETPVLRGRRNRNFEEIAFDRMDSELDGIDYITDIYTFTDDDGDTVTWSLGGADSEHFRIDNFGGLYFDIRPDFENPADTGSNNVYDIVVQADDGSGESNAIGTRVVTVRVTNFDETPAVTDGDDSPSFAEIEYDTAAADLTAMSYIVGTYTARDEEDQPIAWSLGGTDAGDFRIDRSSGVLSFAARPNYEDQADNDQDNDYEILVKASDNASPRNTRDYPVTVTVTNVNETPEVTGGSDAPSLAEIEYDAVDPDLTVETYTARDEEPDDVISWSLGGTDAGDFDIDPASGVLSFAARPNFEVAADDGSNNEYDIIVEASDDASPSNRRQYPVIISVTNINERPELTGSPQATVTYDENGTATVSVYAARDEEGGVTWTLTGVDRGRFIIDTGGNVSFEAPPSFESPIDANGDNDYSFTVVATDEESGTTRRNASIDVVVTVADVEEAGVVSVSNSNPAVGDQIAFELSDPDGDIDTSTITGGPGWTIETRVPGGTWVPKTMFPGQTGFAVTAYTPIDADVGNEVRAVANPYIDRRGSGKSAASEATAAVTADPIPNAPPRFRGGGLRGTIEEGGDPRPVGNPIEVTDREGDSVTFGIGHQGIQGLFDVNTSTGQLMLTEALDFETSTGFELLFVTIHDGRDADGNVETDPQIDHTATFRITVADVEEPGVITLSAEEPEIGTPLRADLEDGDGSISGTTWEWARSENGRSGWINISGANSSGYTPVNADGDFYLRASALYRDNRGDGKTAEAVTASSVPSENRQPNFPPSENGRRSVPEHTRTGVSIGAPIAAEDPEDDQLVYSLAGADADAFTIVETTGQLRTSEALDFELKPEYRLTVEVHDGRDGAGNMSTTVDDTQGVTVTIENLEEPGMVALTTITATIKARVPVTAELSDPDNATGVTWQWSRSPNGRTNWVNIANATSADYTPTLEDVRSYIRATASYTDGEGPNKSAHGISPRAVDEPPPVNAAPSFPATENGQREVPEDAASGAAIGAAIEATDFNNDVLTYTLSGSDAASFTIDENSGQLRLAANVQLDFEGKRSYSVTVSVSDAADQNDDPDTVIDARIRVTVTVTNVNEKPVVTGDTAPSYRENDSSAVASYSGADPERDTLAWSVDDSRFVMTDQGRLHFRTPPSFEDSNTTFQVTVTATDEGGLAGSLAVTVAVTDVEEEGRVSITPPRGWVSPQTAFAAVLNDDDDVRLSSVTWQWARSSNRSSWIDIPGATSSRYSTVADDVDQYLRATASYTDRRGSNKSADAALTVHIDEARPMTNTEPTFAEARYTRVIGQATAAGLSIGAPVAATDADEGDVVTYSLGGRDADRFDIDPASGQLRTKAVLEPRSYMVTVSVHDGFRANYIPDPAADATVDVIIDVTIAPSVVRRSGSGGGGGGGGGGGPPPVPIPSDEDFDWNVTRDIESLDGDNDIPTDLWSDGQTLWVLENAASGADAVFAYELESGERQPDREFELDPRNRFSHGIWSDGETVWVADSGQDRLFAYDLESGERHEPREIELAERNRDPRGIWSDGGVMYVLDSVKDALFVYDLESGELLAEHPLDKLNRSPRGIWSDGVTLWVSDDGAKRLFAYELDGDTLKRNEDLEFGFRPLLKAGNSDARGIWSDGDVIYVADEQDDKLYTYNIPDAIIAQLASLSLSDIEIEEFSSGRRAYTAMADSSATVTTAEALATQESAMVAITPTDADGDPENGHQVSLEAETAISITVTSEDGSRTTTYLVDVSKPPCLGGLTNERLSEVTFVGGSVSELEACARSLDVSALYHHAGGVWTAFFLDAPEFLSRPFRTRFAEGLPPGAALVASGVVSVAN